eukprot:TRINITY_DN13089_c0_g1_i1.p1 TRINITY_DN13089_c0_g1~~TRINITY_DN13089_c0_g1_i1.p1  ORF type:complete len:315 (-),score=99.66 TRINITY_DN13089_c0_g1_i1:110-1054(-)
MTRISVTNVTNAASEKSGVLSCSRVRLMVSDPGAVDGFVDPMNHSFSCIDGRGQEGVLGIPGGDMGEFLIALAVYHKYNSSAKRETDVGELFANYLHHVHCHEPFYMHTSESAVEALCRLLDVSEADALEPRTRELQDLLLEQVVKPQYMGCGHIGYCLQYPQDYLVPTELVEETLRTFYKILWCYDEGWASIGKMNLVVLHGCHHEMGILDITSEGTSRTPSKGEAAVLFPLVHPTVKDGDCQAQFFVNHSKAASFFAQKVAKFLKHQLRPSSPQLTKRQLKTELDQLADKSLACTATRLAPTLPIFKANISQ